MTLCNVGASHACARLRFFCFFLYSFWSSLLQFAAALKYLGVLDGKKVTRAAVDLLYIEVLKDQHRPGKSSMLYADVC
jgi:hypothetical protein